MVLNDVASRARSSSPRTCIRSCSRPADSRSMMRAAARTGWTTCRVTSRATAYQQHQDDAAAGQRVADQAEGLLFLGQGNR